MFKPYPKPEPKSKKPKKSIPKRSAKKIAEDLIYNAKRIRFLELHPKCAVFPLLESIEIHHSKGRYGSNYLDESTWFAVSREGHNWIHNNDSLAREKGFLKTRTD